VGEKSCIGGDACSSAGSTVGITIGSDSCVGKFSCNNGAFDNSTLHFGCHLRFLTMITFHSVLKSTLMLVTMHGKKSSCSSILQSRCAKY
jgi:hypothetical protein